MRLNTLQGPFLLHNFSSLYVAVCHVCTCLYGTSVFLLGATVYFGTGTLATPGTHPLASLTGSKPLKISISPSWHWDCWCAQAHLALCVCVDAWRSQVGSLCFCTQYSTHWAISPALKLDSYLIFFKFVQCETDLHKHWNLTSLSSLACFLHRIRFP